MAVSTRNTLPQSVRQKAKKELHEDERHMNAHIESFRRWVESLPHITYPTDPNLLLPFLRHAKYRHDRAQARLDNFCSLRASDVNGVPRWFHYPPVTDPIVNTYLKSGILVELGRTKEDVLILLVRAGAWDMDAIPIELMRSLGYMNLDRLLADPVTQIAGYGLFFDMTGLTSRQLMHRRDKSIMKLETKVFQDGYPLRVKHLIYYNEPSIVDAMFKISEAWISEKIKKRILRVKENINKAYEKVPGLKDLMPVEYGGKNGRLNDLIENHRKRFLEFYSKPSPWATIRVDESRRPDTAKNYMREYKDINMDTFGTKGTYISLDPGD
ncbi:Alpha-tocopherol transfer protein [Fasciolopsis buskii]|uniref:Alpha-tocopherol transfer protein n=1 Tax=Fasciolopsis buskii TaxID=27845 RepID=A0A8E0S2C0_9TREM|nr:Alpha-tocopherol transfer protein [Fasciolopsis buski]